ncbi:NAD(P)/FAD-dependent oxidoreductase [Salicibibacter halophilus]|uniref:NAD(P)/FAD-dependent oxidoreductase n=1 Tax=Salicibibacter halophilus TaxID=2502791 RepID=A0A514LHC0_9BACI|nr:NAD(P)/FAD-dependent oxidoreductase [Salicibibacter halophilus]QDI91244.1 NAD(P)/FAD-dependent oxidoreductase [Salicibibacter halophilus]
MSKVIVIGGGPAGLMAAVAAASHGADVTLIDKGNKLGRKLAISGGGRCNVTNRMDERELIHYIPGNGKFMYSPFSVFNNEDIIAFFEGLGISLKEEDMGRMFPVNDKAATVVQTLLDQLRLKGVETITDQRVTDLAFDQERVTGVKLENNNVVPADQVIVATGGTSVPHTGSTGDAYPWAREVGHTVTELYPTEVPITSSDRFIGERTLQGLSLRDVEMTVWNKKKKAIVKHEGDMLFTHFGISGPIALRCSQYIVKERKKNDGQPVMLSIDLHPGINVGQLEQKLQQLKKTSGEKSCKNALPSLAPERFLLLLLEQANIEASAALKDVQPERLQALAKEMKSCSFSSDGTLSLKKAFITGGGVSVKEIEPKTMQSKIKQGLYFCGEVLDIHAYTGGFNITCAFSTGYAAGKNAAQA